MPAESETQHNTLAFVLVLLSKVFGIVGLIGIPAVFNVCVATGILPCKGLPLPFISYGGSNLLVALAGVGMLLRIARDNRGGAVDD